MNSRVGLVLFSFIQVLHLRRLARLLCYPLQFCFHTLSTFAYSVYFPKKGNVTLPSSLHRHYSVSSVLYSNPTSCAIRLACFIITCIRPTSFEEVTGSLKLTAIYQCITCDGLRPRGATTFSHNECCDIAFCTDNHISQPD